MKQNHATIMPKKYRYFLFVLKITILCCQKILKKTMYLRRDWVKIKLRWFQKIEIFRMFKLRSEYYAAKNIGKKHVLKMWMRQNQNTMIPKNKDNILYFCFKSQYYNARIYWKSHVFKTWPSENQTTMMMPKKWRYFLFVS